MAKTLRYVVTIVAVLWIIEAVDFVIPFISLDTLGIHPRTLPGLLGIAFAPFLHGNFYHLAANTVPFAVLSFILILTAPHEYFAVFAFTALTSGAGSWLFGERGSVHIGISGVIFGMLGFLLARGFFTRNLLYVLVSGAVAILYGGIIFGIFPTSRYISWECHLFGFLGGVLFAKISAGKTA